ncbi:FAD binding domain-containing protein [Aquabacter spiritensis]|uniref:2-polyprenyl-6-methoxyphenol hydroxylase-like FAD-dependent oxidoreductase n=1 Tax=Aquabacter spiritensis TaxID=933073 RepID=A0A4R3M370_9HYPH|nr:FAD binding domain-containing protein [Aquabacter spiritensis]TCT06679.1 2-polyprenyl-6-methoxyphenol hydroxylase-like FAD-dependent oxidoreductase [Aquabacter spiritensis]
MAGTAGASKRALIIGGSMAGLFTALSLRRLGWDVHVYERIGSELSGRGAGIVTHAELFEILKACGADSEAARVGVFVPGRRVFARDGSVSGERALEQVVTSWGHLYGILRETLPADLYHHGRNLAAVEEGADGVVAHFEDGGRETGALLVGADGIFSTVRGQFVPEAKPKYAGYIAWRGLVPESDLSARARADMVNYFAFSLPPGEQMLGYPVAGEDEAMEYGRRRYNFVWYRPAPSDTVLRDLLTDSDGVEHALSIPPNKIRPDVIAALRRTAAETLSPQFAEVVARTAQPFIQVIQDLETPRMALGAHTVILGDAAFVARPHVGMGVTKAAGDAAALAAALARTSDVPAALQAFDALRRPYGAAVVRRARQLGAYMQAQLLTEDERISAERHRQPEAIMAETAVNAGIAA